MLVGFLVVAPLSSIFTPWSTPNGWSDQRGSPSKHRSDLIRASIDRINKVPTIITLNPLWKTANMKFKDSKRTNQNELIFHNMSFVSAELKGSCFLHVFLWLRIFLRWRSKEAHEERSLKIHYSSENPPRSDLRGGDINRINRKGPGSHQDPISNTQ